MNRDLLTEEQDRQLIAAVEEEINEAVREAEAMPAMAPDSFFDYTFADPSPRLEEQRADLLGYVNPKQG
jgi:pyruvate dehydrogenase E1 component alpha subunit